MSNTSLVQFPKRVLRKVKSLYKRLTYVDPYRGDKVECTICHSTYSAFGPYGASNRPNVRCHKCGSAERHRLLWLYLKEKTNFFTEHARLLHCAPEHCFYQKFVNLPNIEYHPCDIDPTIFPFDKAGLIEQVDITDAPYTGNSFDVIICNHVLEHIPDDRKAMAELYRVMKTGGWGIFQVPIDYKRESTYEDFSITSPEERQRAFGQFDHVRWYGRDYKERLASVGFDVHEDSYVHSIPSNLIDRYRLKKNELIYYCRK